VTLSWSVSGETKLELLKYVSGLLNSTEDVLGLSSKSVTITETVSYKIRATNDNSVVDSSLVEITLNGGNNMSSYLAGNDAIPVQLHAKMLGGLVTGSDSRYIAMPVMSQSAGTANPTDADFREGKALHADFNFVSGSVISALNFLHGTGFTQSNVGVGLDAATFGSTDVLNVKLDGATLEVSSDGVKVKAAGVTKTELNSDVAGAGISGGAGTALAVDLNELSAAAVNVAADSIAIIDADDNSSKKESIADLVSDMAGTGLSAASGQLSVAASGIGEAAVASGDKFVFEDATDNTTKKESIDDIATFMAGSGLVASSGVLALQVSEVADAALGSGDKFVFEDATDNTTKKESIDDIATFMAGSGLNASTGELSLVVDSTAFVISTNTLSLKSTVAGNGIGLSSQALFVDLNELSAATVNVAADSIAIIDADDNSSKKESIADLVSGMAGDGLAAASGQLKVDASEFAGTGLEDDGSENLRISAAAAGNGLSGGGGSALALDLNELSAAAVNVAADSIAIIDADDNSSKKESVADLVAGVAGTGLSAASGQLSFDVSTSHTITGTYKFEKDKLQIKGSDYEGNDNVYFGLKVVGGMLVVTEQ
jgi:hypothetical protein